MTKREILIRRLIAKKARQIRRLDDEALMKMADNIFNCADCPADGAFCDKSKKPTCLETIKEWFYEGGSNGNNNI